MNPYNQSQELSMTTFFSSLSEKEKRHYAAVESNKLGWGGQSYISRLFGITRYRIRQGIKELSNPNLLAEIPQNKQRRVGGGRKKRG